ncbi:hypothetical protein BK708_21305 [Bacillus thuringiensis serovar yunnanensis]|nr:hypothetical protein BK708_21305 [Bacillus thuringiensis serovar yunnanensis]
MKRTSMYKVLATTAILGQTLVGPVLSHADTVSTNTETHSPSQNQYENKLGNLPFINFASDVEDFRDKPKEAKDWIKGKLEEQKKKMSSSDTQTLQDFTTKDNKEINEYLNKNKGELIDNKPLNLKIEKLDTILRKEETKIDTSIKVYRTIPNMKIEDAEKVKNTILPRDAYTITSLTNITGSNPIVEITIPKGSHVVYGIVSNFGGVITERGAGLLVTDVKQITDKGIVRTKIEATLISGEEMRFTKDLGIGVNLDVKDLVNSKDTLKKANELTGDITQKFKDLKSIFPDIKDGNQLFQKLKEAGVTIKFQDYPLDKEEPNMKGEFHLDKKELQINIVDQGDTENTFAHELGHAIDETLLHAKSYNDTSFQNLYLQEKQNYIAAFKFDIEKLYPNLQTAKEQAPEYFADAFAKFLLEPDRLKQVAPGTYEYIKSNITHLLFK